MPLINIRFAHYPSRAPLIEVEVSSTATLEELRVLVEEKIANGEALTRVYATRWCFLELIRGVERPVAFVATDDQELVQALGIADETTIYVEGPLLTDTEGIAEALQISCARFESSQRRVQVSLSAIADEIRHMKLRQDEQFAQQKDLLTSGLLNITTSIQTQNIGQAEVAEYFKSEVQDRQATEQRGLANSFAEQIAIARRLEEQQSRLIRTLSILPSVASAEAAFLHAGRFIAKFPGMPMKALWEALIDPAPAIRGPEVPLAIINDKSCGIDCRSTKEEGTFSVGSTTVLLVFKHSWRVGEGSTPLILASLAGRKDVVQALLAMGADVNETDAKFGRSALFVAAANKCAPLVEFLVLKRADISARDKSGDTPLAGFESSYPDIKVKLSEEARSRIKRILTPPPP